MEEKSGLSNSENQITAEQDKLKRGQQGLSTPLFKLFGDHAVGLIYYENYVSFTTGHQSEQKEIQRKIADLNTKLEQQADYQANAEQLCAAISGYLNIENLTPPILNKLIDKIQVGHAEKVDGQMMQTITIVWRFTESI